MATELKTFRELCCARLGIPTDAFEETVFWECFPPERRAIGRLKWRLSRSFFDSDLALIRDMGKCTNMDEFVAELNDFYDYHHELGFQRRFLHIRISGQRLVNFANQFLPPN